MEEAPTLEFVLKRNPVERLKREKSPLSMLGELPTLIATGYMDIEEDDLVRLKWWGVYHDKPGVELGVDIGRAPIAIDERNRPWLRDHGFAFPVENQPSGGNFNFIEAYKGSTEWHVRLRCRRPPRISSTTRTS
ncbi:MAG: hypothetical protein WCJ67_01605 [Thermoleophilia bacterium]